VLRRIHHTGLFSWVLLVVVCVGSRMVTTITYIEDPDSLRFALSVADAYDIAAFQPHFPGYPVFWAAVKPLYVLLGSFSTAFSVVGGLATAGLIGALLALWQQPLRSAHGLALAGAVLLNPLLWLMANRYMPDLLGAACALAALAACLRAGIGAAERFDERAALLGVVLAGLLAGLRLSYVPLVVLPVLLVLWRSAARGRLVLAGGASVAVWLVPMIVDTGWGTLVGAAWTQTTGHFTEFGGTVQTESDFGRRTAGFVRGLWADGLAAWWPGRHPLTVAVSAGVLGLGAAGAWRLAERISWRHRTVWIGVASVLVYAVWIFFFQNVIHKSRHVLPLIPLLLIPLAAGAAAGWRHAGGWRALVVGAAVAYGSVTLVLVNQHRAPSAIAQAKTFVARQAEQATPTRVVSVPLVNTYLSAQDVEAHYVSVEDSSAVRRVRAASTGQTIVVGTYAALLDRPPTRVRRFYHNPFVNRMWPEVAVFVYDH